MDAVEPSPAVAIKETSSQMSSITDDLNCLSILQANAQDVNRRLTAVDGNTPPSAMDGDSTPNSVQDELKSLANIRKVAKIYK